MFTEGNTASFQAVAASWDYYIKIIQELDVSTPLHGAVFYAGEGNRVKAEAFAREHGKQTLEMTQGGRWFLKHYPLAVIARLERAISYGWPEIPLSAGRTGEGEVLWQMLAERFASAASGNVVAFVEGAGRECLFNTVEFPALLVNEKVRNIVTGGV